jgi:hypothetical protein
MIKDILRNIWKVFQGGLAVVMFIFLVLLVGAIISGEFKGELIPIF